MAISSFFDLFFSTPSAEQKALIQKYPYIDVRVLGKPERVELEAELYRDMGERAYRSLLSRMGTTTVVNFAASDLLFKKMTGETGPEVSKLPLRQRCLQLCQMDRRNAFWARLPQREDLRMVVERAFPSFAEGRELATPADWVRIQEVLREFERRMDNRNAFWARLPQREDLRMVVERAFPTLAEGRELATPAEWDHIREVLREFELCQGRSGNALDRIAFDAYLDRLRLRDFYEREIKCARQLNCPEAVAAFEREIQQGDKPVYPLPERLRLWMGHSEAKGLVDKLAQDILEGHSLKLNWNNHLARSAHIAEIRAKGGRGEDLDRFDKIAVELEKLFENRELLDFLEEQYKGFDSGAEKRKYDLAKAAKQIAEIPLSFFNWMGNIQTLLNEMKHNRELRADFSYCNEELRIRLQEFYESFPPTILAIGDLNPQEVREKFSAPQLEAVIDLSLKLLNGPGYQRFPTLLSEIRGGQTDTAWTVANGELLARHAKHTKFCDIMVNSMAKMRAAPVQVQLCVRQVAKALSRPNRLQPQIYNTLKSVLSVVREVEKQM